MTMTKLRILAVALLLASTGVAVGTAAATAATAPSCGSPHAFHPAARPDLVTNTWLPLTPGTQFLLKGTVDGQPHEIRTTVTDLTKVVGGVRTIVVLDEDLGPGGVIQEAELALFAQDRAGAVRALGEYPEVYENGTLTGAPDTWITGVDGAIAGTAMLAHPTLSSPAYVQGRAPTIEFDDCAKVFQTGQHVCVPVGCFDNVLVTDEWAPNDPSGGHHRKYYVAGLGLIRVDAIHDTNPEVLHLARTTHLCPKALDEKREQALKEDNRGYQISPDVFGHTGHAKRTLAASHC
jgi:hypothetical protein